MSKHASPTVAEALRVATERLFAASDTARLDAEALMAHALGVSRSAMLLRHMRDAAPATFAVFVERRASHEPVAYIVEEQEFYGRTFRVSPAVLIPRSDSEATVAAALEAAPDARRVLDCGTGSGALLLTVLAELPAATGVGIDRSPEALAIAAQNATQLGLERRARLQCGDWTASGWAAGLGRFDLVIANPPYVESGAALEPDVRDHEPAGALFAGPDGLADYRVLVPQLPPLLSADGVAVLEIGAAQADAVTAIAHAAGFLAEQRRDLGGRPRALILRRR
ncbi:MAG: peptide chain release factor N(5)-glutamine methyltransferase [Tsuneonella sp.]